MRSIAPVLLATSAAASGACDHIGQADDVPGPSFSDVMTIKSQPNPDLDLLFVVDDSASMADKQTAFTTVLPLFLDQLDAIDGGRPNIHFGVASSDMGTSASATAPGPAIGTQGNGGCASTGKNGVLQVGGATLTGNFLVDTRQGTKNYTGNLVDAMTAMLRLGETGCGFEQTLSGMRAALDNNPMNAGFVRPSANLAVIVLSDEDDCSAADAGVFSSDVTTLGPLQSFRCFAQGVVCDGDMPNVAGAKTNCKPRKPVTFLEDPQTFQDFLLGLKGGDARMLMFGAVMGDPTQVAVELTPPPGSTTPVPTLTHSCKYATSVGMAVADPPVRIASLVQSFPGIKRVESVCSEDLTPQLGSLGKAVKTLVGDTCLAQPLSAPASCILVDVRDSAPAAATSLPACDADTTNDCFELVTDAAGCPDGQHQNLLVHRSAPAADDSWSTLRCEVK